MTDQQLEIIEEHLTECIRAADTALANLGKQIKSKEWPFLKAHYSYWRNCRSGLRWALALARQQNKGFKGGESEQVQQFGPNSRQRGRNKSRSIDSKRSNRRGFTGDDTDTLPSTAPQ